jgi:hypothetical protein
VASQRLWRWLKDAAAEDVRLRLKTVGVEAGGATWTRIETVLNQGDILTANEYIHFAEQSRPLPEATKHRDALSEFFPEVLEELESLSPELTSPGALLSYIKNGKTFAGINMKRVPDAQLESATSLVENWLGLKRTKRLVGQLSGLDSVLKNLGFTGVRSRSRSVNDKTWVEVDTDTLNDRTLCPVPYFGSRADGHYRVLCIWDRLGEEEIVNQVGKNHDGPPVIVLYFNRLTENRRRELARLCRSERRTFLFVDEALVLFLCGETGPRLPVLFECALPFTYVNPFTTTASLVPPEMFYGRRQEHSEVMNPMGSCFIYGGRQLGKTALLLSVQREFHDPTQGRIARWIDLKANRVLPDKVWQVIARTLKDVQDVAILPALSNAAAPKKLVEAIAKWLDANSDRRILLLLHEADQFLEADGDPRGGDFLQTRLLKSLMERTGRRFKVVFAGLHNVQRISRQQNHPLAHFGEPLCIGPLLEDGELREAYALVERPLFSMGFPSREASSRLA